MAEEQFWWRRQNIEQSKHFWRKQHNSLISVQEWGQAIKAYDNAAVHLADKDLPDKGWSQFPGNPLQN